MGGDIIEQLASLLSRHKVTPYRAEGSSISVPPASPDGFCVTFEAHPPNEYWVWFEGWHEVFSDPEEAIRCFMFGLSEDCRLVEERRGTSPYRWTVQKKEGNDWATISVTGLLVFPFWKRKSVRYLHNHWIKLRKGEEER